MVRYPVLIEMRSTHVVWVEADDQADAVEQIKDSGGADLDQLTDVSTLLDGDWEVTAPDEFDWHLIQGHEQQPDFHVRAHEAHLREAARAECAAAGHHQANHRRYRDDVECDLCRVVVATVEAVAV